MESQECHCGLRGPDAVGSLVAAIVLKSPAGAAVSCPTVAASGAVSPEPVSRVDWDGCDLAGADLSHQQMTCAGLIGADLSDANLTGAVLGSMYQDDLHGANLTNANGSYQSQNLTASLSSDNLRGAVLAGTDLFHGDLSNSDLTGATGLDSSIVTSATIWTHTICPNATSADYYSDGCTSTVDVTTPSATPAVTTGTTGTNGWYTSPVTVSWHWADVNALTGNCPASTPRPARVPPSRSPRAAPTPPGTRRTRAKRWRSTGPRRRRSSPGRRTAASTPTQAPACPG